MKIAEFSETLHGLVSLWLCYVYVELIFKRKSCLTFIRSTLCACASLHFRLLCLLLRQHQFVILILRNGRAFGNHLVNQTVLNSFFWREILRSTHIFTNRFFIFARKRLHKPKVILFAYVDFVRSDLDIHRSVKRSIQPRRRRRNLCVR